MRRLLTSALLLLSSSVLAQSLGSVNSPWSLYDVEWDNFRNGFQTTGANAKWFYFGAGPFVGDDGIESTRNGKLTVKAKGTNPSTGKPMFTKTVAPESQNGGLPGGLDHVKWLSYMSHFTASGQPGFDAVRGRVLSCEAEIGGRTYGTAQNPFGTLVDDPNDDLRLGSFALNSTDFESFMVFDFFVTNKRVYAFYERLPFGRSGPLGNYAAFSHQIPVFERRNVNDSVKLRISYDRSAGKVSWWVNERKVFEVDRIGYRLQNRQLLTLDHGGQESLVDVKQLDCGMGLFTLLDGYRPSDIGLVRISEEPYFYYDPNVGPPALAPMWDDYSAASNRLWGQGAEITVENYRVSSRLPRRHGWGWWHGRHGAPEDDCDD